MAGSLAAQRGGGGFGHAAIGGGGIGTGAGVVSVPGIQRTVPGIVSPLGGGSKAGFGNWGNWGNRGNWGNSGWGRGRFTTGFAYPVYIGSFGYPGFYGYPSYDPSAGDPSQQPPQGPPQQPNVTVVYPPPSGSPMASPYGNPYGPPPAGAYGPQMGSPYGPPPENGAGVHPQMLEVPPQAPADTNDTDSAHYLIAFKDHTIYSVIAYWVDGETLHYFTSGDTHNQVSLSLVDRDLTKRLNEEAGVELRLPAPKAAK